jgi:glycosyltransferase involved in cell wall biosynthesis
MTPIRVLHVAPSLGIGGREVRMATLIDRLGDEFEHVLVALDGDVGMVSLVARRERVRVHAIAATRHMPIWHVYRLLQTIQPALLVTYNWGAVEVAACASLARYRAIVHIEDGFDADEAIALKRRRVLFRRAVLPRLRKTVVISRVLEQIAARHYRVPQDRLTYIPNAIDTARFTPADGRDARAALGVPAARLLVGAVARLKPEKDLGLLIRAVPHLLDLDPHVVIVGDGSERAQLQRLASDCGVAERVTFAGSSRETWRLYPAFDLFALTSRTEQAPLTVLEAMACGLPVVATAVGDLPSMLPDGAAAGVLAEPTPQGIARSVRGLANRARRLEIGAANRAHVERTYSLPRMVAQYAALYRSAAGRAA